MEYNRHALLKDVGDNDVRGIAVIETSDSHGYRVTEQRSGDWCLPIWMDASELQAHDTEYLGQLDSEQFSRVCEAADPEILQ